MLVSKPKKKNSKGSKQKQKMELPTFHPCSAKYFAALSDPWSPEATGSCVPFGDAEMTHKARYFKRLTMTTGTAGVGWCLINPPLANDVPGAYFTTNLFGGINATPYATASTLQVGVSSTTFANAPYPLSDLRPLSTSAGINAPQVAGRLVSVGVSIEYTGTVMNMSGLLYSLVEPSHANLALSTATELGEYPNCLVTRITDERIFTVAHGINQVELDFVNQAGFGDVGYSQANAYNPLVWPYAPDVPLQNFTSGTAATGEPGAPILLMVVLPASAGAQTFNVEIVVHAEYKGYGTAASQTPSHVDEKGGRMVLAASGTAREIQQAEKCDWACAMSNSLSKVIRENGPSVLREGTKTVMGLVKKFSML